MRKRSALIIFAIVTAPACAHMSEKQRALTAVAVGAAVGAGVTALVISNSREYGEPKDVPMNALIGAAAGGAYSLFFQKSEESDPQKAEIDRRIREAEAKNEMGVLNDGKYPEIKAGCSDEDSFYFCSSNDPRVPSPCKDIGTIYLNKNTAIKYKVWYSPKGCFENKGSSYKLVPELENYFDKVRKN